MDQQVLAPNDTSPSMKQGRHAWRRGPFALEDRTPDSEFEEFAVITTSTHKRFMNVSGRVEAFRIPLVPHECTIGTSKSPSLSSSSSSILISTDELSDANATTKLVEMKCFICGTSLQLPSYAALQKKCHLKCSNCETGETHAKNWMDIILTALYNLEILHQRQYFHCKSEICAFIDHHWSSICPERARTPTWGNTVMSQISTHPELFQSHQRGSGYWALKRSSPNDRDASRGKDNEGDKDVRGDKRAENKNKRRTDQRVLGEEDDEAQEYFIEEIMSKRIRKGNVEYLIKWEGLADSENSWERAQDLECPELVQDFESEARKNPLWKEGSGLCSKRKREEPDVEKGEKKARRLSRKQTRIPVSQWCHQCLRHKPVIMCCDGVGGGPKCRMQYCERCLEKYYDEEIVVLQKAKGDWACPRCRGVCCCAACDPEKYKAYKQLRQAKKGEEPAISRIIARCKVEGTTGEWEYLVHYKGRAESENRWVRSTQLDLVPHLRKRYRNTLKMRVSKKGSSGGGGGGAGGVREMATPEVKQRDHASSKAGGTPGGPRSTRTPKGLRTSDFDISRVVFDDQVHRIVVPEKPEVATPAWRIVTDTPAVNAAPYGRERQSNGDSVTTEKVAGVVELDAETLAALPDEGSSSEDTSDEAFVRRHSRYETVYNPTEPKARRRGSMGNRKSNGGNKNNKAGGGGRREDEHHSTPTLRQQRERRNSRASVDRRRSDSQLVHYGSDDLAIPDVMRVEMGDVSASVDAMDVVGAADALLASSSSMPPTPTSATPLTEISAS